MSPNGRRLWIVDGTGTLFDVDLAKMVVAHQTELGPGDGVGLVPFQELNLTADGKLQFVSSAPGEPELRAEGNGSVVWIVDTDTLERVATVPLPAPASRLAPTRIDACSSQRRTMSPTEACLGHAWSRFQPGNN